MEKINGWAVASCVNTVESFDGTFTWTPVPIPSGFPSPTKQEEKATTMTDHDANARRHLQDRLYTVTYNKRGKLDLLFNRYVDNTPKTCKDLIDAIKNDKFKLDEKRINLLEARREDSEDEYCFTYNDPFDGIIWDGPQYDEKGLKAAKEELDALKTKTTDVIMVGTPAEGLAALQAFEAWLPEGKAN